MEISAKVDYAVRALLGLAERAPELSTIDVVIGEQKLPRKFAESILSDLRRAGLVRSQRGAHGGYALARPAREITLGAVFRAVDGPLAEVRGRRPDQTSYTGVAEHLPEVWVAVRASLRRVLDETTLEHVLSGRLPRHVARMVEPPEAWLPR
ncbi:MAG: Rrf2 family transcriptional regulator [Actinomycetota bacterium]|nr:Rrf2 family transcriptional regulator [Actinomycetota bacterium]